MQRFLMTFSILLLTAGCATYTVRYTDPDVQAELQKPVPSWPDTSFMVISDTHVYPVELGIEGEAFEAYLNQDRKLLRESQEIMIAAKNMILEEKPGFVLISGDLTKDGEKVSHEWLAGVLEELRSEGIPSYVVPGNHDIQNPHAVKFEGANETRVPTVTPQEFASIYQNFGYGKALERDPSSLSYLAEPVPGLWLLAMDSCKYDDNLELGYPVTSGSFTQARLNWIESILIKARKENKAVIGMLHHTVTEQYDSQRRFFPEYVIDHDQEITNLMLTYGVRMVFSGHYHAHDITVRRGTGGQYLYSLMTGSLVTYPNPVRMVNISQGNVRLDTRRIESIPSLTAQGKVFQDVSREYAHDGISVIAVTTMVDLGVPKSEAESLSSSIADAFIAHYQGDENFTGTEKIRTQGLSFMGGMVVGARKDLIEGLWKDLEPQDNEITIKPDGSWSPLPR